MGGSSRFWNFAWKEPCHTSLFYVPPNSLRLFHDPQKALEFGVNIYRFGLWNRLLRRTWTVALLLIHHSRQGCWVPAQRRWPSGSPRLSDAWGLRLFFKLGTFTWQYELPTECLSFSLEAGLKTLRLPAWKSFFGCLKDIQVNHDPIPVTEAADIQGTVSLSGCPDH